MAKKTSNAELAEFARSLAEQRLRELYDEIAKIHALFPDIRRRRAAATSERPAAAPAAASKPAVARVRPHRRPRWTPAMKKAARDRMKKYWAEQRALRSNS